MEKQALAKAAPGKRLVAILIDGAIFMVLNVIPVLGTLVGAAYILTRDSLVYTLTGNEDFRNRSIGKKLMGLRVVRTGSLDNVDLATSIKRNFIFVINIILLAIGVVTAIGISLVMSLAPASVSGVTEDFLVVVLYLALAVFAVVTILPVPVECMAVLISPRGLRVGDLLAGTQVVED